MVAALRLVPYVRDTIVADVEAEPHLDMQVLIIDRDGFATWHRYQAQSGEQFSACDEPQPIKSRDIIDHRIPQYGGAMCRGGCFSKSELVKCDEENAEAARKREERWGR